MQLVEILERSAGIHFAVQQHVACSSSKRKFLQLTSVALVFASCGTVEQTENTPPRDEPAAKCEAAGATCRPLLDECDVAEQCVDSLSECPNNVGADDGTVCSVGICSSGFCLPVGALAAYWPLNTTFADVLYDSTSFQRDGQIHGAPAPIAGNLGQALRFDGTSDAIEVADFPYGPDFSVSLWFSVASAKRHVLVSHGGGSDGRVEIFVEGNGRLTLVAIDGQGTGLVANTRFTVADDSWHQASLSVIGGVANAFVDGTLLASAPVGLVDPSGPLFLGSRTDRDADSLLEGALDDVRIYEQGLSASETIDLYVEGNGRLLRFEPVADAEVRGGTYSDINLGSDNSFQVKNDNADHTFHGMMRFDLTAFPANLDVRSASVTLHVSYRGAENSTENALAAIGDDSWEEGTLTYATLPVFGANVATWTVGAPGTDVVADVNAAVAAELAGDRVLSLGVHSLVNVGSEGYAGYNTRESNYPPVLELEIAP